MVYDSATWANRANAFMPPDISLAAIAGLRDDLGVLSVYAEVDPAREASQRATWVVSTRSALHALVEQAKGDGDRKRRYALEGCLERIEPQLGDLLDARLSGRGRALFAGVGSRDDAEVISLQVPLPTTVRLAERAYLRPLVEALDRGRAAGLVAVSKAAIRVVEQRLGAPQELLRYDLGVETDTWRELRGRAAPSAVRGQQSVAQRERFERRVEEHQVRELHGVVHEIAAMAEERGWDRVAVSGQPQLRAPVVEALSQPDREIVTSDRDVAGLALRDVALALASDLEAATDARERMLVERALTRATRADTAPRARRTCSRHSAPVASSASSSTAGPSFKGPWTRRSDPRAGSERPRRGDDRARGRDRRGHLARRRRERPPARGRGRSGGDPSLVEEASPWKPA